MITRAERLELFSFCAREKDCLVCSGWPRAGRAKRRSEVGYVEIPFNGTCARCWLAFAEGIVVYTDGPEESEAWEAAVLEELKKPRALRRHGQEILDELRARKAAKEH